LLLMGKRPKKNETGGARLKKPATPPGIVQRI